MLSPATATGAASGPFSGGRMTATRSSTSAARSCSVQASKRRWRWVIPRAIARSQASIASEPAPPSCGSAAVARPTNSGTGLSPSYRTST